MSKRDFIPETVGVWERDSRPEPETNELRERTLTNTKQMSIPEKGLIIRQPYIGRILDGTKTWEMRTRFSNPQGRIALIEAGSGTVVGECIHEGSKPPIMDYIHFMRTREFHNMDADEASLIVNKWDVPWVLSGVKRYIKPIPYDHPQGAVIWVNLKELAL